MPVNYEIKANLARLLSTEDLLVENKKVPTACFDVESRVLTLPMWDKASNDVYDMLVGHEVGHALYTPNEWDFEERVPRQFVNVTEDARIEKLMKRRYPGIAKSFYRGYKELSEDDFFDLKDKDLTKMNLADRINLYFKIGNFQEIPILTEDELEIVNLIQTLETFQDSVDAAEKLYQLCRDNKIEEIKPEKDNQSPTNGSTQGGSSSNSSTGEPQQKPEGEKGEETENEESIQVETDEAFQNGTKDLSSDNYNSPTGYYESPNVNIENVIVPNQEIHKEIDDWFNVFLEMKQKHLSDDFQEIESEFESFKKSAQKEVNYLVKEFECRKSADSYARTSVSRSGVLDCSKLHTYRYEEDLFKKISVIPDGKNHGLIFILDWSGSMAEIMVDTIKQLYNLIWFCKKVTIPFEVYAFTSYYNNQLEFRKNPIISKKIENQFIIDDDFSLMNLFTHKTNKRDLDHQMKNIWKVVKTFNNYTYYTAPPRMSLSGTPLNESLICLHKIIPQFKQQNKLQKVQCVILTDGEAPPLRVYRKLSHPSFEKEDLGSYHIRQDLSYLRNRKTGHTYKFEIPYWSFTKVFLDDLRQSFPDVNFIGFRVIPSREFISFINRYEGVMTDEMKKNYRKQKNCVIKDKSGYHSYFILVNNSLSNDVEFDVEEDASKSKIKSAFSKSLKSKSLNKKILGEFVELVC
jgi:hypothetical protein